MEPGCVTIPCPIIHQTEMIDDAHAKVYGTCWILNYVQKDGILESISGGEIPAVILLERADEEWVVMSMEEADIGDDYCLDIHRFAHGMRRWRTSISPPRIWMPRRTGRSARG